MRVVAPLRAPAASASSSSSYAVFHPYTKEELATAKRTISIALIGPPGAGKSTLATCLITGKAHEFDPALGASLQQLPSLYHL